MKKSLKTIKLPIISAGVLMLGALFVSIPSILENHFLGMVPDNSNFTVPSQLPPEEIIPQDWGGSDYTELVYDRNLEGQKWMVPCFSGIGTDDAEDVCRGFVKGYLRKYTTYKLFDGTVVGGKFQVRQDTSYAADGKTVTIVYENEKLRGDYSILLNVLEYESPDEAKSACSFLITDSSYKTIQINGVNVLSKEWEEGNWAHFVLPTDKTVISIQGNRAAVKEAMNEIVERYKVGL